MSLEDAIGLGPRHLPSLHIGFCGGKDTQRNQCGQVIVYRLIQGLSNIP
jgi:hypothetical protein